MLKLISLFISAPPRLFRRRRDLVIQNRLLRHQFQVALRAHRRPESQDPGSIFRETRAAPRPRVEAASDPGPARDCLALASPGLAALLALALRPSAGPAPIESRGSRADRHYGEREPALGHPAHPGRAAQAVPLESSCQGQL